MACALLELFLYVLVVVGLGWDVCTVCHVWVLGIVHLHSAVVVVVVVFVVDDDGAAVVAVACIWDVGVEHAVMSLRTSVCLEVAVI